MMIGRRFASVFACAALLAAMMSSSPASAGTKAPHAKACGAAVGHSYRYGVVPPVNAVAALRKCQGATPATGPELMAFNGGDGFSGIGVTSGTPKVYLVFWGNQWGTQGTDGNGNLTFSGDYASGAPYMQQLMKGLGTGGETWSGVMTQYCDGPLVATGATVCPAGAPHIGYPNGGALAGVWYDNSAAEPASATFDDLSNEAISAAAHFGNTTAASNRYVQYVVLSAPGTNPDDYQGPPPQYCAWHSATFDGATSSYLAFTNMPYIMDINFCGAGTVNSPGTLDGYSIVEGHEYAETITDQIPTNGWTDSTGGSGENGDKCAWIGSGQGALANVVMGTGTFAMQSTFSNDTDECDIAHPLFAPAYENAIQSSSNSLIAVGSLGNKNWNQSLAAGTSPTMTTLPGGGYETAFHTSSDGLIALGNAGNKNWNQSLAPGTSPSITMLPGGYEIAFQSSAGTLVVVGTAGNKSWGNAMMAGTSPSITALPGGGYEVAFQSSGGQLVAVGNAGNKNWQQSMAAGTSPSIVAISGAYEMAFQASTGKLVVVGAAGNKNWQQPMATGTSPSITALPGGYEVAIQTSTNGLIAVGNGGNKNWNQSLAAGTSPSIAAASGGYEIGFQAGTGKLIAVGAAGNKNWQQPMLAGTSPSIVG